MIKKQNLQLYFFLLIFIVVAILSMMVLFPFINAIALAFVLAIAFKPLYYWFNRHLKSWPALSSILTILVIFLLIIIPLTLVFGQIVRETRDIALSLMGADSSLLLSGWMTKINELVGSFLPGAGFDLASYTGRIAEGLIQGVWENFSFVTSSTLSLLGLILDAFIVAITLFFLLKDGPAFKRSLIHFSPLDDDLDRQIMAKLENTINAVVRSAFVVALIKGGLTALGLVIFDVPNVALWSLAAGLASMIPGVGTALVFVPIIIYMFFTGGIIPALGLLIWAALIVGLADNILVPYFYSRGVKIHPVLILLSVLGGLAMFGGLGFVFGPLILSLFFTLLDLQRLFVTKEEAS
ncbi:MAG: hypothetical protein A2589_00810 [Candidatus Vogelbacteria bacterium RIFOXYD1_FULL_46_19]|uniref:AI-2E family transporter n=1 Tax=Candidatus Vogelbacteria bacterium RIFOXYD1_FULL_46_19 TaxID=1802439 RepID=A0A1G2QFK1_9BACT|nr:MAG: hypothetical protein A2589_00810 [Candidatus Vogelbacteria bacterium RIFOXYD1_FULL_46_19]